MRHDLKVSERTGRGTPWIPYKIENKKAYTLITVRDDIVHQLRKGESWIVIDSWAEAGSNVVTGKLGFFIPPQ